MTDRFTVLTSVRTRYAETVRFYDQCRLIFRGTYSLQ
uniref:Uncharacterized protein n=1 Tax=Anguilla anguilla TaxID=7936 RepID=A0A0E9SG03_ANGAN